MRQQTAVLNWCNQRVDVEGKPVRPPKKKLQPFEIILVKKKFQREFPTGWQRYSIECSRWARQAAKDFGVDENEVTKHVNRRYLYIRQPSEEEAGH